jgi:hypothetical protein
MTILVDSVANMQRSAWKIDGFPTALDNLFHAQDSSIKIYCRVNGNIQKADKNHKALKALSSSPRKEHQSSYTLRSRETIHNKIQWEMFSDSTIHQHIWYKLLEEQLKQW